MSVDKFGQYKRNKKPNRPSVVERLRNINPHSIVTYLKGVFSPHDRFSRYYLVLFILYWIIICCITGYLIIQDMPLISHIILVFGCLILGVMLNIVIYPLAYLFDKYTYIAYTITAFCISISIWIFSSGTENSQIHDTIEMAYMDNFSRSKDIPLPPTMYFAHNEYPIYTMKSDTLYNTNTISRNDTLQVIGERGYFYRANIGIDTFYILKGAVLALDNVRRQELKRKAALHIFSEPTKILRFTDGTFLQKANRYIYIGNALDNNRRSGRGTLIWKQAGALASDSMYIGQWREDMMNGEGIFYNNHTKQHIRGIWSNTKLTKQIEPLSDTQLQVVLDSVSLIENRIKELINQ